MDFTDFNIEVVESDARKGVFKIGPLPRGFGHTLANPLRRVLLSSLPGAGVTSLKISGVDHEYSTIKGVKETVIEAMMNIKSLRFKIDSDEPQTVRLSVKGAKEVKAKDLDVTESITVMDPNAKIMTLTDKSSKVDLEMVVEKGVGYQLGNEDLRSEVGRIPIDAIFSPVERVSFTVEETRKGGQTNLDQVVLTVFTDGSVTPQDAVSESAKIIGDIFEKFPVILQTGASKKAAKESKTSKETSTTGEVEGWLIEDLSISKRTKSALIDNGIKKIKDLQKKTATDLRSIPRFGAKALEEVETMLKENGLSLKEEK